MTRKYLLITDIPPNQQVTAGLFLNEMARLLPVGALAVFTTIHPFVEEELILSPDIGEVPYQRIDAPYGRGWIKRIDHYFGSISANVSSFTLEQTIQRYHLPRIVKQATAFGRDFGANAVWTVLQSPVMFRLARRVAKALDVPLYSFVMDPPNWWLEHNKFDPISSQHVIHEYESSLRESAVVGCGSWNMAEEYHRLYGTRTVAIVPSQPATAALPPATSLQHDDKFVIGFAGQLYAAKEWQAFIRALNSVNWRIGEREIILRLMGEINLISQAGTPNLPVNIEMLGWRSQAEVIQLLAESDVCYCPYRFAEKHKDEARLAFPSKLTTYLSTGRPVFFHGPDYSSPGQFLAKHDAGILCYSMDTAEIIARLTELVNNPARYATITQNGTQTFHNYLTLDSQRVSVAEFLEIPVENLHPLDRFTQKATL